MPSYERSPHENRAKSEIIKWSNGREDEVDGDILEDMRRDGYVAYDAGGFRMPLTVKGIDYADRRSGRVALIWENEDIAKGDDGSHAIAEILYDEERSPRENCEERGGTFKRGKCVVRRR